MVAFTPGHFLVGRLMLASPELINVDDNESFANGWQKFRLLQVSLAQK